MKARRAATAASGASPAVNNGQDLEHVHVRLRGLHGNNHHMNDVVDFINVNRDRYVDELKQYLAIPSISALPEHATDVRRAAQWTADALTGAGMRNVKLIDTPGHPVVYGDWLNAPGKPTVLFYGHYDVQPVDPLNLWTTPPVEATVRDGEIYARGSADDKGQVF